MNEREWRFCTPAGQFHLWKILTEAEDGEKEKCAVDVADTTQAALCAPQRTEHNAAYPDQISLLSFHCSSHNHDTIPDILSSPYFISFHVHIHVKRIGWALSSLHMQANTSSSCKKAALFSQHTMYRHYLQQIFA